MNELVSRPGPANGPHFSLYHNTFDHSTRHNHIDLSLNKAIDNSTRTSTYNQNQPGSDSLPTRVQERDSSTITKLSDAPLHSLLGGCERFLQHLVDQFSKTPHSSKSLHIHCISLHHTLCAARGTLWDHAQQLVKISNQDDPIKNIDQLSAEFMTAVRSDGIHILEATHDAYLALATRGDGEGCDIRAEILSELLGEYMAWNKNVGVLEDAIQAEERRLGALCIQNAFESGVFQQNGRDEGRGNQVGLEDLVDGTEVELRRRWARSKL